MKTTDYHPNENKSLVLEKHMEQVYIHASSTYPHAHASTSPTHDHSEAIPTRMLTAHPPDTRAKQWWSCQHLEGRRATLL